MAILPKKPIFFTPIKNTISLRFLMLLIFIVVSLAKREILRIHSLTIDSTLKISFILCETNRKVKIISIWSDWTAWSRFVNIKMKNWDCQQNVPKKKNHPGVVYITQFNIIYPPPRGNHFCVNISLTVVICLYKTVSSGNLIYFRLRHLPTWRHLSWKNVKQTQV